MDVGDIDVADIHVGYGGLMPFVGRQEQLRALKEWWEGPDARPALVWGRRRVGKTALLQEFASDKRVVFHTGGNRTPRRELAEFSHRAAHAARSPMRDLRTRPFGNWDEAFDHLGREARDEPLLLVLDEFPEMIGQAPELEGVLRAFLDHSHGQTGLRIVLCGSAVRTMQAIQEYRAPLYGRFDLTMQLHPFRPHEAAEMLSGLTPPDRALVYGILGGMPLYLSWWRQELPVEDNLRRLACRPDARMIREGDLVLATEAGQGAHLAATLQAIADGCTKHNEIADAIGADPTRTLNDLLALRLVERLQPVTESARTRRKVYRITDNFLAFYLGTLSRVMPEIDRGLGETVLPVLTASLDDHMGDAWEEAFRDHLRLRAPEIGPEVVAIGPWWRGDGQHQIDAVALSGRSRTPILVGEAKWSRKVNAGRIRAELAAKAAQLTDDPGELRYAVCARESVTDADAEVMCVTAADIFAPRPS
ncbi:ATP-binding protein [Planobispora takensis]|uniref:ArsR family transcriptional regulator n=1 Tax=Planobispora takensis TaxID=1367882 RepID=A0A8J3T337_9ACTN|nr:ATP-binding protein [Planobispora takensis]GII03995.1 ArsR family transcriptional regulator [Planobispora takensis]